MRFLTPLGLMGTLLLVIGHLSPGAPRRAGTLHHAILPGIGDAWIEFNLQTPPAPTDAEVVRPEFITVPTGSGSNGSWNIEWRHSDLPAVASLKWDGTGLWFSEASPDGPSRRHDSPIHTTPVAELILSEHRGGLRAFRHGTGGRWKSIRPRWLNPTALDLEMETRSVALEEELRSGFFKEVRDAFSFRDLLLDTDTGNWSCELHQVVHHHSTRAFSVLSYLDSYTGGAHGGHRSVALNLILGPQGAESLTLPALFPPAAAWHSGMRELILTDLRRQGASSVQPTLGTVDGEPTLKLTAEELRDLKFTANADGIQIQFDPYEAGSYAEGRYVVEIPWARIRAWVRPEVIDAFTAPSREALILKAAVEGLKR